MELNTDRPKNQPGDLGGIYLTQPEESEYRDDRIFNEDYHRYNPETGRPEIDITKYKYKIKELENLRREAL
jgi:hypothetical protein